jgi:hypothetical protein
VLVSSVNWEVSKFGHGLGIQPELLTNLPQLGLGCVADGMPLMYDTSLGKVLCRTVTAEVLGIFEDGLVVMSGLLSAYYLGQMKIPIPITLFFCS